jgi:EAL domain-containing protein (putative c-di-GMP-specific phosphodiesterase class I)
VADAVRSHGGLSVATGITTARQLAAAWQTSVDLVQGDFLGPAARSLEFDFSQFQH